MLTASEVGMSLSPFPDPANCKNTMIKPMHNRIQIRGPLKMRDAFFIDYLEA